MQFAYTAEGCVPLLMPQPLKFMQTYDRALLVWHGSVRFTGC